MHKPTCKWPDCDNTANIVRGFCQKDYRRAYRLGNFDSPWIEFTPKAKWGAVCRWPGCDRPVRTLGLCERDEQRARSAADKSAPWIEWAAAHPARPTHCKWPGCKRDILGRELCSRDYQRALSVGDFDNPWVEWDRPLVCEWCGGPVPRAARYKAQFCSRGCGVRKWQFDHPEKRSSYNAERRARSAGADVEKFTTSDLRQRDGDGCYICGKPVDFAEAYPSLLSPSLDHVIPLVRGGAHSMRNAAVVHLSCNARKGRKTPIELGLQMPRFTKGDLTVETSLPTEAARLKAEGFREARAKTAEVKAADADAAKPEAPKSNK